MVNAQHKQLSIPMPGHYIELDELKSSVSELDELISTHDIIYLLMDTRESRSDGCFIFGQKRETCNRSLLDRIEREREIT